LEYKLEWPRAVPSWASLFGPLAPAGVHSVEGCAYQIRYLLTHPDFAALLGRNGREHVKENFLLTSNLRRWLLLFQIMLGMARPARPETAEKPA